MKNMNVRALCLVDTHTGQLGLNTLLSHVVESNTRDYRVASARLNDSCHETALDTGRGAQKEHSDNERT